MRTSGLFRKPLIPSDPSISYRLSSKIDADALAQRMRDLMTQEETLQAYKQVLLSQTRQDSDGEKRKVKGDQSSINQTDTARIEGNKLTPSQPNLEHPIGDDASGKVLQILLEQKITSWCQKRSGEQQHKQPLDNLDESAFEQHRLTLERRLEEELRLSLRQEQILKALDVERS